MEQMVPPGMMVRVGIRVPHGRAMRMWAICGSAETAWCIASRTPDRSQTTSLQETTCRCPVRLE